MRRFFGTALFLLLSASPACALDMEYYTYGGFTPITEAFTKIALIFSDSGYQGLLFVVMVLGLLAAVTAWLARAITGAQVIPLVWAVPVVLGAVLYLALFVPKGSITVYDPVLNRFQTVGDVPDAVVFTAGFLNKIERGMVDIIDTAAAPNADYSHTAGGIGFKALEAVRGSSPKDSNARNSMIRFIKDCVSFELVRPGTSLSLETLRNDSTDFLSELSKAVNPAVYTVAYDTAHPEGENLTCTAAWNRLQPIYANPTNYDEAIKKVCSKAWFDPDSSTEMATCKSLLTDTLTFTTGSATTPEKIIQQRQLAELLYTFYFQDDYETAALMEGNRKIASAGLGIGLTMNEWIPVIRAVMTAIAIGVIPFLALFLFTPVVGKALSVMFGFFVFLTTWGITDAVIHGAAMDYAAWAFEDMRQSSLGVYAMAAFPTLAVKQLTMFGVIRSAGIMLASFFSMMLIRFGGHALAMMAGNLSRIVQSGGAQAGQLLTPEGTSAAMERQVQSAGLLAGMPEHRFSNMAAAKSFDLHQQVGDWQAMEKTKDVLTRQGAIPTGTSDKEMAEMIRSSRVTVGTEKGRVEVATAPDGHGTMVRSESVNRDGSRTLTTTGEGGSGVATDELAEGQAAYNINSSGGYTATAVKVNGLDPVSVTDTAQQQKLAAASHNLGTTTNWANAWDQIRRDSVSSTEARSFGNRLDNAVRENWRRSFADKSSFTHTLDETTKQTFDAIVSGKFKKILGAGGQIVITGQDGEKVSFEVSEDTAKAFSLDQARVRSESLNQAMGDTKSVDYMTRLAKQIGASEAYSNLNDAREMRSSQTVYGANLLTALVRNYAVERYGDESPENIRKTIRDFNHSLTGQGREGVQNMHNIVEGFVSGKGYGWGTTAQQVENTLRRTRQQVAGQDILRAAGNQNARDAVGKTAADPAEPFPESTSANRLREPSVDNRGVKDAELLREMNRREEAGEGRIQTTATGMAVEGVDKVLPGMVESQGMRPTDADGVFNPEYGFNAPKPIWGEGAKPAGGGPVDKDAPSCLK